ncbi:MAG: NEW3 domain-containing protein [Xanthobacteraceae bacterium]
MRLRFIAAAAAVVAIFAAPLIPAAILSSKAAFISKAMADDAPKDVKGLFLMSDYPAVTLRPGETSTVSLRLQNYDMTPEGLALSVDGVPSGWTATLLGGGQPVAAAMPATDSSVSLSLRLDVPKNAPMGTQTITVAAQGNTTNLELPIAVTLAKDLPAKLTLTPQLPELRGTSKSSFEYQLGIKNDSGKKLTVSLAAQAPQNFDTSFTEQYGTQELNAVPVDAGQTKDVKLKVTPPNTAAAGDYKVTARVAAEDASATSDLEMTITGQPRLDISGREGLVSTRASAGKETSVPVVITNTGTAPADDVELTGSAPSGWKVTFDPKTVDRIAPNDNKEVQALITPTDKAIAGDYVTTIRASARGESASTNFRVTVTTSTMWGIAGVGIVGIALLIMVGAVARFGRR